MRSVFVLCANMRLFQVLEYLCLMCILTDSNLQDFIRKTEYQLDYGQLLRIKQSKSNNSETHYFREQLVDHFDPLNAKMWNQTYFVHEPAPDTHVSDVPVVLVGGEGPEQDDFDFLFRQLLPDHNSMGFTLAHRYYQPGIGINPTDKFVSSRDSRLLSSKQALADLAYFIEKVVMEKYKFKKPPIVFGCSYPGSLTIWFRQKYPHLSIGGIALSGPIVAEDDFHQYLEVGEIAVEDTFPKCFPLLSKAKHVLQKAATAAGTYFADQLNLCTGTGFTDWQEIFYVGWVELSTVFAAVLGQGGSRQQADSICKTLEKDGPFKMFRVVLHTNTGQCQKPQEIIERESQSPQDMENAYPDWFWQKCTEFGWFKTHSNDSLFQFFKLDAFHKVCNKDFGVSTDLIEKSIKATNIFYGGRSIRKLKNLLIMNGADDPWHAVSMTKYGNKYNGVVSRIIPHAHHCTFINATYTDEAKQYAKDALNTWLA